LKGGRNMRIVGTVSTLEEAKEIEFIAKAFVTANRAKALAIQKKEA
jgi:hypothetical protein